MAGPLYCSKCKRANAQTDKTCIWCGAAIEPGGAVPRVERTQVEIDYISGIDGLDDPGTVKLEIDSQGLRVSGGHTVRVDARSIVQARVVDATYTIDGKRARASGWWWLAVGPLALLIPGKRKPDEVKHDYLLTVDYRSGGRVKSAVFHREDRLGLSMMEGLARIISSLPDQNIRAHE
ncbi:MAG: hypothetical protein ACREDR_24080 [Blastocatellia bacterium]